MIFGFISLMVAATTLMIWVAVFNSIHVWIELNWCRSFDTGLLNGMIAVLTVIVGGIVAAILAGQLTFKLLEMCFA